MSKAIGEFFSRVRTNYALTKKFGGDIVPGHRIVPTRTNKNDELYQLRIDAGELVNNRRNIVLQVNSQAKNTAFKKWIAKKGTDAKLAVTSYDVTCINLEEEIERALAALEELAKGNIQ
jgi:hypothetical protein